MSWLVDGWVPCIVRPSYGLMLGEKTRLDDTVTWQPGEKTGTPMFISVGLSQPQSLTVASHQLEWVRDDLSAAQDNYADHFLRAFPAEDGTFMRKFAEVMDEEGIRLYGSQAREPVVPPKRPHDRRHDAESMYWVFLWFFARARPLDVSPADREHLFRFNQFCFDMSQHTLGGPAGEVGRSRWLIQPDGVRRLFHPDLKPFEELFVSMAGYLSIPWHLYSRCEGLRNIMQPDHVHVAFRRFVLAFMLDPANAGALEVELDTAKLRWASPLAI